MGPTQLSSTVSPAPARSSLGRTLLGGTSALGVATLIERGLGFLANLGAARLGGAQLFGAYSVALTAAMSVASYAGAGIGTTANRFSAEYPYGRPGYGALLRALLAVSAGSAMLAAIALWFAAEPIARYLLRNPGLTPLLHLAALSAGAMILLECLRGLLIGQRRFAALLCLCILSGGGLLLVLPMAASRGASVMISGQAVVLVAAVLVCIALSRRLGFAPEGEARSGTGPKLSVIVRFGAVQLAGIIGLNAAGWWIASLVTRADLTLVQMGFYSVASQLRNICGMPPLLISQAGYALMTDEGGQHYGGPGQVTVFCTFAATAVSLLTAGAAASLAPWLLPHIYGRGFAGAELAATLAVATGLVHMSAAPAAARLSVVSLRLTGVINVIWTGAIIAVGTWLIPSGGAAEATAAFLVAHVMSAMLVLGGLLWLGAVPWALAAASVPGIAGSLMLATLGWLRSINASHNAALSAAMMAASLLLAGWSLRAGMKSNGAGQGRGLSSLIGRIFNRNGLLAKPQPQEL